MMSDGLLKGSETAVSLCLEASGNACSAALFAGRECLSVAHHHARHGHSEHLVGLVEQVCEDAQLSAASFDYVIAGCGPGSFTGLRVCLAAAQGYRLATDAYGVGLSTLSALAFQAWQSKIQPRSDFQILSCCDTRRRRLFTQLFDARLNCLTQIDDLDIEGVLALIKNVHHVDKPLILTGDPELISAFDLEKSVAQWDVELCPVTLDAGMLGALALYPEQHFSHLFHPLEPIYVHPAITVPAQK